MKLVLAIIRFYRLLFSPLVGSACRFEPSCSRYSEEAFRRYGLFHGAGLTIRRIAKCQPFHPGGSDPIP